MGDPFLDRLTWICARTGSELEPPAGPRDPRTLSAVRRVAGLGTPRALELWFEGKYPTGRRTLDSLERLDRHARRWPDHPPADGYGPTLAEVARAAWAQREAPEPAPVVERPGEPPARRRRTSWRWVASGAAAVAVALVASVAVAATSDDDPVARLTFNDLGGGSPTIRVYAGPGDTDADRVITGRYPTGDEVTASCVARGRLVTSDPSVGEEARSSDLWVRLDWTGEEEQYATLVYADVPDVAELPACD